MIDYKIGDVLSGYDMTLEEFIDEFYTVEL